MTAERDRARELARIEERIAVIANWLLQGRCGDDAECVAAKRLELESLDRTRAALREAIDT